MCTSAVRDDVLVHRVGPLALDIPNADTSATRIYTNHNEDLYNDLIICTYKWVVDEC